MNKLHAKILVIFNILELNAAEINRNKSGFFLNW